MGEHYFDIETTGLDPAKDEIVTIQFRDWSTGNFADVTPTILKAWESNEKTILQRFLAYSEFFDTPWKFLPVGFNLDFEMRFLFVRAKRLGLVQPDRRFEDVAGKPRIDLKPIVVLMNNGSFKGASLENFSAKPGSGETVLAALERKDYRAIEEYVTREMWGFARVYARLRSHLPAYWRDVLGPEMMERKRFLEGVSSAITIPVDPPAAPPMPPSTQRQKRARK